MFIRLLLISVAAYLLFRWVRGSAKRQADSEPNRLPEVMVKCAHCDLHLPQSRALGAGELWFCSSEHKKQHVTEQR